MTRARGMLAALCVALGGCGAGGAPANGDGGSSGDGGTDPEFVQRNLDDLNMYRAQNGAAPLTLDAQLSTFAAAGSAALESGGTPHQHFMDAGASGALWSSGFCSSAGENQAPMWPATSAMVEDSSIDAVLAQMMAEGPGGGHHDNIVNPKFARVGIALLVDASGQLWLTNDFSEACP